MTSVIRGHHVYKEVWDATIGEMLEAASDKREEAREYDKYAVGLYKKDLLVGHIPIEISSLCFHFINQDPENKIKAVNVKRRLANVNGKSDLSFQQNLSSRREINVIRKF